jgi:ubiquitin C-terminal hydrolase
MIVYKCPYKHEVKYGGNDLWYCHVCEKSYPTRLITRLKLKPPEVDVRQKKLFELSEL